MNGLLCYMVAGDLEKVVSCWLKVVGEVKSPTSQHMKLVHQFEIDTIWTVTVQEKCIFWLNLNPNST